MSFVPTRPGTAYLCLDSGVTTGSDLEQRREAMTGAVSSPVFTCTDITTYPFSQATSLGTKKPTTCRTSLPSPTTTVSFRTNTVHGTAYSEASSTIGEMNWKRLVLPGISVPCATTPLTCTREARTVCGGHRTRVKAHAILDVD
ncbi:hypothetical protein ARMGADRAFT_87677 [Armillaria gallica]|uniref:Uncharacterized protein n=1 Tax=Armillaria gallica TaxID=47427 RepID=A0A2H3CTR3_ARMGA|nr:hypothetical protein ARMGADRAFT_87677 [Armillaria gallica]